ncbi:MAG: TIGR03000 domain-containing protein [Planctomycetes bacterium]|nr:TIGR03000 domain-containing protein [Planctomycetota bacterium]
MKRRLPAIEIALAFLCIVPPAFGQRNLVRAPAQVRVLLPQEDATLFFDGKATKQKGSKRHYTTPPLPAHRTFTYKVTAKWWPNNYTEVIRARTVAVRAGQETLVDLRQPDPKHPDDYVIRFVPTPDDVVDAMCKLAQVGKDDVVYDLGCGDGRIVITAVSEFKAKRGVGIDIDPRLVKLSTKSAKEEKVDDRVTFRQQDVLTIKDLSEASVVMMYMGEDVNKRLMPILKKTLKPGSRIVSHDFPMGDWKADKVIQVTDEFGDEHELYLWTIRK